MSSESRIWEIRPFGSMRGGRVLVIGLSAFQSILFRLLYATKFERGGRHLGTSPDLSADRQASLPTVMEGTGTRYRPFVRSKKCPSAFDPLPPPNAFKGHSRPPSPRSWPSNRRSAKKRSTVIWLGCATWKACACARFTRNSASNTVSLGKAATATRVIGTWRTTSTAPSPLPTPAFTCSALLSCVRSANRIPILVIPTRVGMVQN